MRIANCKSSCGPRAVVDETGGGWGRSWPGTARRCQTAFPASDALAIAPPGHHRSIALGPNKSRGAALPQPPPTVYRLPSTGKRSGVILLVVMLLLSLLAVLLLTLVAVTAQGRLSALASARAKPTEPSKQLLNQAFAQVVRGSTYRDSVIGAHSLLEDLYGNGPLYGRITSAPVPLAGGAVADLPMEAGAPPALLPVAGGEYAGRVITFLTGPAKGHSARIICSPPGAGSARIITPRGVLPIKGDLVLINGQPFSGTGFGCQPAAFASTRLLGAMDPTFGQLRALLPNHAAFVASADYADPAGPGGAHEDYDAADFQNMLLAFQLPPVPGASAVSAPPGAWTVSAAPAPPVATVLPSLHRPDLINYWSNPVNPWSAIWDDPDFRRRVILRPLPHDHPQFTGGNPEFDPTADLAGPWDVDNDNDGSPDSIWVDLGFTARRDHRGRLYKPLFAILCVDLDGRLNVNAHGNLNHLDPQRLNAAYGPFALTPGSTSQTPISLSSGSGYGTAEINLGSLFMPAELRSLMLGDAVRMIDGRYGEIGRNDANGFFPRPGVSGADDLLNQLQQFEFPQFPNSYGTFSTPCAFGTPPDLDGDGELALDLRGQPYYVSYGPAAGWGEPGERIDDPYELNLSAEVMTARMPGGQSAIDGRFTPAELSAVLRAGDGDAGSLPQRLLKLAPIAFASPANRHRVTTDSWDLPVSSFLLPSTGLPGSMAALLELPSDDVQAGRARARRQRPKAESSQTDEDDSGSSRENLTVGRPAKPSDAKDGLEGGPTNPLAPLSSSSRMDAETNADGSETDAEDTEMDADGPETDADGSETDSQVKAERRSPRGAHRAKRARKKARPSTADATTNVALLAPELLSGLRFDLNRPLGDGFDDNGNGVVDEPEEAMQEAAWATAYGELVPFDLNNDGLINSGDMTARQDMARWLYVLMRLLMEPAFMIDGDQNPANNAAETARWAAQWAVNVVDFRDRDSIMTPFPYDSTPFDGPWVPDGLVWGCERPQLLITETLAFHDRATEDLQTPGGLTTDEPKPDKDFDQRWMPQGSLFVELYHPWSAADAPPGEFTVPAAGGAVDTTGAIDLARTAGGSPVWRLLIVAGKSQNDLHFDPDGWNQPPSGAYVERSVYFTSPPPPTPGNLGDGQQYYTSAAVAPLAPNCYAVIGPGATTYIGRRQDGKLENNRRVSLTADAAGTVEVSDNVASGNNTPLSPADIKPPLAIAIEQPRRLSVSEPVGGYVYAAAYSDTGGFNPPLDTPLDASRTYQGNDQQAIMITGTTPAFRVVHLQRLANPLEPYNAVTNPYRTIDSMPVDLTSFTGRWEKQTDTQYAKANRGQSPIAFASRQRGDADAISQARGAPASGTSPTRPAQQNQLWMQEPLLKTLVPESSWSQTGGYYFPYPVLQSLGYLNTSYYLNRSSYYSEDGYSLGAANGQFWKSSNPAPTAQAVPPQSYAGDPMAAFPWLTWNNRPFVSQMELLLVPGCQSSRLLSAPRDASDSSIVPFSPAVPPFQDKQRKQVSWFDAAPPGTGQAANLYRLLDFVRVPSRFVASEIYENPRLFTGQPPGGVLLDPYLHPPFNRVSTYREPGRVNLNTVFDERQWAGLLDGIPAARLYWQELTAGRRGYPVLGPNNANNAYVMNPLWPTIFAAPFRSAAGAQMVPLAWMQPPNEINGTLLRPRVVFASSDAMFSNHSAHAWCDTSRNPYFRYQTLIKLGNLATARSNVYAVWITMGRFEVQPGPIDGAHPDGYRLGNELGFDTGEIERHRAFYIYDRSIPVAFKRGEDLNVARGILVKQFIE